ncbi:hypothetical protein BT69DRAFT_1316287 [Atractiella rhizophila]|nr:hypothetical protein BT69DRAFT_1316287 [Atractiella rhizophila]
MLRLQPKTRSLGLFHHAYRHTRRWEGTFSSPSADLSAPTPLSLSSSSPLIRVNSLPPSVDPTSFLLYPRFLSPSAQNVFLSSSLRKLDDILPPTPSQRRLRKNVTLEEGEQFYPHQCYTWEEGHYDAVISSFREAALTPQSAQEFIDTLPKEEWERLQSIFPTEEESEVHLLHLSGEGEIKPHVDSREAFGDWIVGVCLGGERVLVLEEEAVPEPDKELEGDGKDVGEVGERRMERARIEVRLGKGDVYVQTSLPLPPDLQFWLKKAEMECSGRIRYGFKHSIPLRHSWPQLGEEEKSEEVGSTQRLSIMIRERKKQEGEQKSSAFSDVATMFGVGAMMDFFT